jgi:hypothetical protein
MVFNWLGQYDLSSIQLRTTQNSDFSNTRISVNIKAPQMTSLVWGLRVRVLEGPLEF